MGAGSAGLSATAGLFFGSHHGGSRHRQGDGARAWGVNAAKIRALGVHGTTIVRALTCLHGGEKALRVLWGWLWGVWKPGTGVSM